MRIANNACVDLWRRKGRRNAVSLDDAECGLSEIPSAVLDPESAALDDEGRRLILDALTRMPDRQRNALTMFYFGEMSIRDMSQALGRPEGTIKSDLHLARETLRRKLEGVVVEV
jgi:RNA polymerase sigma-70 factor (ECF subfamily)